MFKKYAVVALSIAAGLPVVSAPLEKQLLRDVKNRSVSPRASFTQVIMPQEATVADLLTSTVRAHTGFNIPTMPETVHTFFMRSAPMSMKSYNIYQKLACGVEITSAGLLRFIKNAHLLFFDKTTGRLSPQGLDCQFAVQEALKAHRVWYAKKTTFALIDLNAKEDEVFRFLQKLPLNDPKIKMLTENLISTSEMDHNRLFARTTVSARGSDSRAVKAYPKGWFRGVGESFIKSGVFGYLAYKAVKTAGYGFNACYVAHVSTLGFLLIEPSADERNGARLEVSRAKLIKKTSLAAGILVGLVLMGKDLYDWKTDYNLTPEPNGGVNLRIKLKDGA